LAVLGLELRVSLFTYEFWRDINIQHRAKGRMCQLYIIRRKTSIKSKGGYSVLSDVHKVCGVFS
jgi:hypothetical protein